MERIDTLVEFFSDNTINNVLGAFAFAPRRVVFLTDHHKEEEQRQRTLRALSSRLPETEVRFFEVEDEKLETIDSALEELWREYPGAVFDFTGGSETVLLSSFAFAVRREVPMMHIHMESHSLIDIQGCQRLAETFVFPRLTLEDHLNMHGAFLTGVGYEPPSDEYRERLRGFCELVLSDQHKWKAQCLYIQMAAARTRDLQVDNLLEFRTAAGMAVPGDLNYLRKLEKIGMIEELRVRGTRVRFRFPDVQIKHCLCDSGKWLELMTYLLLKDSGRFHDVRMSVRIGWGEQEEQTKGTAYNEIDVIACAGITPLFISCKSGLPNPNSMNEILVYARKFGGARAKAAMVTSSEISHGFVGLRKRAVDLGTVIVDESDIKDGLAQGMLLELLDSKT